METENEENQYSRTNYSTDLKCLILNQGDYTNAENQLNLQKLSSNGGYERENFMRAELKEISNNNYNYSLNQYKIIEKPQQVEFP